MPDITSEIITNNLKKKVDQIRNDRKKIIKELKKLLYSDVIFLLNDRIRKNFRSWLIKNNYFVQYKNTKKKRKRFRKYTDEYQILYNLYFSNEIKFYGRYDHDRCPYTGSKYFYILELNGEIWLKYELILNKIKKAVPDYLEHFYKTELLRLCDKKFTHICEKCGTKNEKCAVYCNICGNKLESLPSTNIKSPYFDTSSTYTKGNWT